MAGNHFTDSVITYSNSSRSHLQNRMSDLFFLSSFSSETMRARRSMPDPTETLLEQLMHQDAFLLGSSSRSLPNGPGSEDLFHSANVCHGVSTPSRGLLNPSQSIRISSPLDMVLTPNAAVTADFHSAGHLTAVKSSFQTEDAVPFALPSFHLSSPPSSSSSVSFSSSFSSSITDSYDNHHHHQNYHDTPLSVLSTGASPASPVGQGHAARHRKQQEKRIDLHEKVGVMAENDAAIALLGLMTTNGTEQSSPTSTKRESPATSISELSAESSTTKSATRQRRGGKRKADGTTNSGTAAAVKTGIKQVRSTSTSKTRKSAVSKTTDAKEQTEPPFTHVVQSLPVEMAHITEEKLAWALDNKFASWHRPRSPHDLYTPRYVHGKAKLKEGLCLLCDPPCWFKLKCSNYWYHLIFSHGISSHSGRPFNPPLESRVEATAVKGLCGNCNNWIVLEASGNRNRDMNWRKHCQKCYS